MVMTTVMVQLMMVNIRSGLKKKNWYVLVLLSNLYLPLNSFWNDVLFISLVLFGYWPSIQLLMEELREEAAQDPDNDSPDGELPDYMARMIQQFEENDITLKKWYGLFFAIFDAKFVFSAVDTKVTLITS